MKSVVSNQSHFNSLTHTRAYAPYIYIYIYVCVCVCVCVCIRIWVYVCGCACVCICLCAWLRTGSITNSGSRHLNTGNVFLNSNFLHLIFITYTQATPILWCLFVVWNKIQRRDNILRQSLFKLNKRKNKYYSFVIPSNRLFKC